MKLPRLAAVAFVAVVSSFAGASHTPAPSSVTIAGSLQGELGCPGDWMPECAATGLAYDPNDGVWQRTFLVPAGSWEYKAALDGAWSENYGLNATQNGANLPLALAAPTEVKFFYDHATHWVTDGASSVIATVAGSFQSELGCSSDWDPGCLRSWLQDPDGDGIYVFEAALPAGLYEGKVAIDESWSENYGAGGTLNGPNLAFPVPPASLTRFEYDAVNHLLAISSAPIPLPPPTSLTIAGSLQSELGCPTDWDPACAATGLAYDANDDVWQGTWSVPAGSWEYKAALDGTWDPNYGLNATENGANLPLSLAASTDVKFYYDHTTHWVTSDANAVIATVAGSFQSELGCSADWDPGCLRSWLEDPDGDGTYAFEATLPEGSYEAKVAIDEGWDENYGAGGVLNGINLAFTVADATAPVTFQYDAVTHVLTLSGATVTTPTYAFSGFFPPVDNEPTVNTVKAGKVIAVKFSLGGDQGLDVFQAAYPTSAQVECEATATEDVVEETVTSAGGGLTYDASTDRYVYLWKTAKPWGGTCRQLVLKLADGSVHTALFHFAR